MRRIVGYDTFPHNEGEMPVIKMIGAYGFTEHDAYCVSITDYGSGGFLRLPDEKEARRWFKEIARHKKNLFSPQPVKFSDKYYLLLEPWKGHHNFRQVVGVFKTLKDAKKWITPQGIMHKMFVKHAISPMYFVCKEPDDNANLWDIDDE